MSPIKAATAPGSFCWRPMAMVPEVQYPKATRGAATSTMLIAKRAKPKPSVPKFFWARCTTKRGLSLLTASAKKAKAAPIATRRLWMVASFRVLDQVPVVLHYFGAGDRVNFVFSFLISMRTKGVSALVASIYQLRVISPTESGLVRDAW